jgi:intracellular sulfur oxidation DsrE/DsrF family protein
VRAAAEVKEIIPALEDAAALVNGLAAGAVPPANRRIVVVFYGPAAYGILDNETYRQKYGADNPNLQVISELRQAGVELFVCGQWLRYKNIEESKVVSDVQIAADALIVVVAYQNRGYAHLIY